MSGGYLLGSLCNATAIGVVAASTLGTTITSSGSNNTAGSWTQLTAATAADCSCVEVCLYLDSSATAADQVTVAVDIGIGGAGSEIVLIPSLVLSPTYQKSTFLTVQVPVQIPAGTRIAARCQTRSQAPQSCSVSVNLYDSSFELFQGCGVDTIGYSSATTLGTALTPSATANTMGSYSQLTASTPRDYVGVFGIPDIQDNVGTSFFLFDIAIGGAGSEIIIMPTRQLIGGVISANGQSSPIPYVPIQIPAGTRIAARCQANGASVTAMGLTLYGVY